MKIDIKSCLTHSKNPLNDNLFLPFLHKQEALNLWMTSSTIYICLSYNSLQKFFTSTTEFNPYYQYSNLTLFYSFTIIN